jgi:ATP-dependent DNA helicase RecG
MPEIPAKSASERLATPIQFMKGVGPSRAELLEKLGMATARDVLFNFPRDYQDLAPAQEIANLKHDLLASVAGVVEDVEQRPNREGKTTLGVLLKQGDQYLRGMWFNQPFMREKFKIGERMLFIGAPRLSGMRWQMNHPRIEILGDDETPPAGELLPVYSLTEGLSQIQMRKIAQGAVETFLDAVEETLPEELLALHGLWPIQKALPVVHNPANRQELNKARRRFVVQELLVLQLALAMRRRAMTVDRRARPLPASSVIDERIRRLFPFSFTEGQNAVIAEVAADMARQQPMNRLLQGEVGSGKTVVAMYAMLLAAAHGCQAALMAPTELLARQHAATLAKSLEASRVQIVLLAGSLSAGERALALARIASGEAKIVVGTQAIAQQSVTFEKLGLVVIDEGHKFGVRQRATLKQAGPDPHYLVMTATPIPRTVSMTLFGDLDLTTLREAPPGRQAVHSYLAGPEKRSKWWDFFRKKLREGRQGFVVAPLVEESESTDAASATETFERLARGELADFPIGLLHGRMDNDERQRAMEAFRRGETRVLVATSVVEVGIDVPNATLMTIEGGERFGLAQLHQLRGRISRGAFPGYLCVFAEPQTDEARQRLEALIAHGDGFTLAEADFRLRGPGDLFGTKQHGLPPLRIADLQRDTRELEEARRIAQELVMGENRLNEPGFERLKKMVIARYGKAIDLSDVG